jgi:histidinol-phosphate aminotransferase
VALVAEAEGLPAHRHAVEIRFTDGPAARGDARQRMRRDAQAPATILAAQAASRSEGLERAASVAEPVGSYQWEPSDAEIAARYGLDRRSIVRFDMNTVPRPPAQLPDWLAAATGRARLNEYPDASYARLTDAAAEYAGVRRDEVVVGAGADEMLDLVARVCLSPGGRAVVTPPTYAMYAVLTRQRPAGVVEVPRRPAEERYRLDADALVRAAASAGLVWLCDPDNPTGTVEESGAIAGLLARFAQLPGGGPVVALDEAYREFAGETLIPELARRPNLIVVRTLSKAFGLAGIRVGYAVAQPELAARLNAVRPPGSIATLSGSLGAAALRAPDLARKAVGSIVAERDRLRDRLTATGWRVPPSTTNFLLLDVGDAEAADRAANRLLAAGLVARRFGAGPMRGCLRLTVRTEADDDRLIAALGTCAPSGETDGRPS